MVHALLLREATHQDKARFERRLELSSGLQPLPFFAPGSPSDLEFHTGQFLLATLRAFDCDTTFQVRDLSFGFEEILKGEAGSGRWVDLLVEPAARLVDELDSIREGTTELSASNLSAWRDSWRVQDWKTRAGEADLSWLAESIVEFSRCEPAALISPLQDSLGRDFTLSLVMLRQLELLDLDLRLIEINFLPEYGVHTVGAYCRWITRIAETGGKDEVNHRETSRRLFDSLLRITEVAPRPLSDSVLNLEGHLVELAFDPTCNGRGASPGKKEGILDEVRRNALLARFLEDLESRLELKHKQLHPGMVSHSLRGLRHALSVEPCNAY